MDNNKKLSDGLLKADGIDPAGATGFERVAFRKMLDGQSKPKQSKPGIARPDIWRMIVRSTITKLATAAVLIVAVLIFINQFGGSIDGASVAWADVIKTLENDTKSTNTIHFLITWRTMTPRPGENGEVESEEPNIVKGECWLQRNPVAGKMVLEGEQTTYFTENSFTGLDHRSKTWVEQTLTREKDRKRIYGMFDALVTGDFKTYLQIPGLSISDGQIAGHEIIGGARTTIYEFIGTPSEEKAEEGRPSKYSKCWIRDSDHKTVRMQFHEGDSNKYSVNYELIEYDVTIPPNMLDVVIPEGYSRQFSLEERTRMISPEAATETRWAYDQARKSFPDYRMMIFDGKGIVKYQIARSGKKWRRDFFDRNRQIRAGISADLSMNFDDLWIKAIELPKEYVESTYMTYGSKFAVGFWPKEGVSDLPQNIYIRPPDNSYTGIINTFEQLVWPKIESIAGPNAKISILPPSEKYPDCTAISLSNDLTRKYHIAVLLVYYIDSSRDYMCVRHERHQRKMPLWENNLNWMQSESVVELEPNPYDNSMNNYFSKIIEITATAQSPEGKWYPSERLIQSYRIGENGERIKHSKSVRTEKIYIDTQGQINPNWLEWPEELPLPSK